MSRREAARDLRRQGWSIWKIATEFGVSWETARDWMPEHYEEITRKPRVPAAVRLQAKALRAKGFTYPQIAKACGIGLNTAWRYCNPPRQLEKQRP